MTQKRFTILGATGFIGSHLYRYLEQQGYEVLAPSRNVPCIFTEPLGNVLYCIGLTADFRNRPFDTINAHICYLAEVLKNAHFDSFLYLSSTRVYLNATRGREDERLLVNSQEPDDLYNLSKLTGEALCLRDSRVKVVRLSNVVGGGAQSPTALQIMISAIRNKGRVILQTTLDSEKDYIWLDDVVKMLPIVVVNGTDKVYNLASGVNISNEIILKALQSMMNFVIEISPEAKLIKFPEIDISRIQQQFGFVPTNVLSCLPWLIIL